MLRGAADQGGGAAAAHFHAGEAGCDVQAGQEPRIRQEEDAGEGEGQCAGFKDSEQHAHDRHAQEHDRGNRAGPLRAGDAQGLWWRITKLVLVTNLMQHLCIIIYIHYVYIYVHTHKYPKGCVLTCSCT